MKHKISWDIMLYGYENKTIEVDREYEQKTDDSWKDALKDILNLLGHFYHRHRERTRTKPYNVG